MSDKPILYDGDTGGAKEARSSLTLAFVGFLRGAEGVSLRGLALTS